MPDETAETPRHEWPKDRAKMPAELWIVVDGQLATDAKWSAHTFFSEKDALEYVANEWLRRQAWHLVLIEPKHNPSYYITMKLEYVNPVAARFQRVEVGDGDGGETAHAGFPPDPYDAFPPDDPGTVK